METFKFASSEMDDKISTIDLDIYNEIQVDEDAIKTDIGTPSSTSHDNKTCWVKYKRKFNIIIAVNVMLIIPGILTVFLLNFTTLAGKTASNSQNNVVKGNVSQENHSNSETVTETISPMKFRVYKDYSMLRGVKYVSRMRSYIGYDRSIKLIPTVNHLLVKLAKEIWSYDYQTFEKIQAIQLTSEIEKSTGVIPLMDGSFLVSDFEAGLFLLGPNGTLKEKIGIGSYADLTSDESRVFGLKYKEKVIPEFTSMGLTWVNTNNLSIEQVGKLGILDAIQSHEDMLYLSCRKTGRLHIISKSIGKQMFEFAKYAISSSGVQNLSFGNVLCGVDATGTAMLRHVFKRKQDLRFCSITQIWWTLELPFQLFNCVYINDIDNSIWMLRNGAELLKLVPQLSIT